MCLLTRNEVHRLGSFDPDVISLWDDVGVIADRLFVCSAEESALHWHHLLLAIANFKADIKIYPPLLLRRKPNARVNRSDSLIVPMETGPLRLDASDPKTWRELTKLRGFGVPRASAVLAALWPQWHAVVDWRSLSAAAALTGSRYGWEESPADPASAKRIPVTWTHYPWYTDRVLDTARSAELPPVSVERALYRLAKKRPGVRWDQYADELERVLRELGTD